MPAHEESGQRHPAVSHAAARCEGGGLVIVERIDDRVEAPDDPGGAEEDEVGSAEPEPLSHPQMTRMSGHPQMTQMTQTDKKPNEVLGICMTHRFNPSSPSSASSVDGSVICVIPRGGAAR